MYWRNACLLVINSFVEFQLFLVSISANVSIRVKYYSFYFTRNQLLVIITIRCYSYFEVIISTYSIYSIITPRKKNSDFYHLNTAITIKIVQHQHSNIYQSMVTIFIIREQCQHTRVTTTSISNLGNGPCILTGNIGNRSRSNISRDIIIVLA